MPEVKRFQVDADGTAVEGFAFAAEPAAFAGMIGDFVRGAVFGNLTAFGNDVMGAQAVFVQYVQLLVGRVGRAVEDNIADIFGTVAAVCGVGDDDFLCQGVLRSDFYA